MKRYIYVGPTRWRRISAGGRGGVLRMELGGDKSWEHLPLEGEQTPVNVLVLDPHTSGTLYAGTDRGLYRSTDQGTNWSRLDLGEDIQVWSVLIHPNKPNTIYIGTSPVKIFRSDDAGTTWRLIPSSVMPERLNFAFASRVLRIIANPAQPNEMYASLEVNGVMRSRDGGENWEDCGAGLLRMMESSPRYRNKIAVDDDREGILDGHAVCVSPAAPNKVLYANRLGIFASQNGGETWTDTFVNRFSPFTYARDIRCSPQNPTVLYACLNVFANGTTGGLFRSPDAGETWKRFDHSVEAFSTILNLALDRNDADTICGITFSGQVLLTEDGGKVWFEHPVPEGHMETFSIACG